MSDVATPACAVKPNPVPDAAQLAFEAGLRAWGECLAAALDIYLPRGWPVLGLCPPDHVGVTRVSRTHIKRCGSPGKRPWHTWKEYQQRLPTTGDVLGWWR